MTRLPQNKSIDRFSRAQARRIANEERKWLALIDAFQRWRLRTKAVLVNLKSAVTVLDYSIETELQSSPTRNPRDAAFPMTARALIARRDNLTATIAALSRELAKSNRSTARN